MYIHLKEMRLLFCTWWGKPFYFRIRLLCCGSLENLLS